jgi:hypothetical protein
VTPNYRNDFESMVINFQKLSIDAADSVDEDGFSQRSLLYNRWETILCKLSSDVSIREKSIKNREEAVLAQEHDIQLLKEQSAILGCKICLRNNCSIICYPCKHFSMCSTCFNTSLILGRIKCPVCRGFIHWYSNVYIT